MEELFWTGMVVALSGALFSGVSVVPIILGKSQGKWYPKFFRVISITGGVIAIIGFGIMVYAGLHHPLLH